MSALGIALVVATAEQTSRSAGPSGISRKARRRNNRNLAASIELAKRHKVGLDLDMDPAEALQEVLDRAVALMRLAASEADKIPTDEYTVMTPFGPVEDEWVKMERQLRFEVAAISGNMVKIGLADRMVKVQEARAALLVNAVTAAARRVGMTRDQIKRLGPALREELTQLAEEAA